MLVLSACGGGGSSSSGGGETTPGPVITGRSAAPSTGPGDTTLLFPTAIGSSWTYNVSESQSAAAPVFGLATISVAGTAVIAGASTSKFSFASNLPDFNGYDQFYATSNGGVTFYGNDDPTDSITNLLTPTPELLFPASAGTISTVVASGLPFGTAGADALTADLTQQISVGGPESVTVDAGVFANAVKVTTTVTGTVIDKAANQTLPFTTSDTSWFAPGVGLVRETLTGTAASTSTTQSFSARGYTIGGIQHGLGGVNALASGLQTFVGNGSLSASNGSNALVVGEAASTASGSTGYLIGSDGKLLTSVPLSAHPPSVAFDGVNFVAASYATNPLAGVQLNLQRISTTGALLDPGPGMFLASPVDTQGASPIGTGGGNNQTLIVFATAPPPTLGASQLLLGMFVDPNGNSSGAQGFTIRQASNPTSVVVAFDGTNYLVVWQEQASFASIATNLYAARVSPGGVLLDPSALVLASGTTVATEPAVAFDGTNFLVVWSDAAGRTDGGRSIYGRRITTSGALLDGVPNGGALQFSASSLADGSMPGGSAPVVAFNGTEYIVAWVGSTGIKGARLSPTGTLNSGSGFELQMSDRSSPASFPLTIASGTSPQLTWLTSGSSLVSLVVHPF